MKKTFRFQLVTSDDRFLAIDNIRHDINKFRGFMMSYKMYSDLQMSMYIELKEHRLLNFYHRLNRKYKVSGFDLNDYDPHSRKTVRVYLLVSFIKGAGKLKMKVPKVPG